jgi:guanylate kinase
MEKRLILLSGPSCVGKGPLTAAVKHFRPDVKFTKLSVIKSKHSRNHIPRPDECGVWNNPDCWRTEEEIAAMAKNDHFVIGKCFGFSQAVNLDLIVNYPEQTILMEMYYPIVPGLLAAERLKNIKIETVFISPISKEEIDFIKSIGMDVELFTRSLMADKQYQRIKFHNRKIDAEFLIDVQKRINDSVLEIAASKNYKHIIVNRDGEGSPNWNRLADGTFIGEPMGNAKEAMDTLAKILADN